MTQANEPISEEQAEAKETLDNETKEEQAEESAQAEAEEAPKAEEKTPEDQIRELNDRYLRLYSEFENFRRRNAKERLELVKTASGDLMADLLPVLDDFERAIASNEKSDDIEAIKEGFSLVHNKFKGILTGKGLKEMEVAGEPFDPEVHEALTKIPAPSKKLKGKVVDVIEKGYSLGEKVIRYSKVVVGE